MDLIYDKIGEPRQYQATDAEYSMTDEQINAALPDALPGTLISKAGYTAMKQKAADGSWASVV
ncbi:MAG: hypothetical protein J6S60_06000 [Oscillospiraceae bacterium]|nr:hypothetical protein [Oscillospiraceae bacterium]